MEAQQTLAELQSLPVEPSQPLPEADPSSKPVFGQKFRKGKPVVPDGDAGNPKLIPINRSQIMMRPIDLERDLPPGHPARAMWDLLGRLDLSPFHSAIRSQQGEKGRPTINPRMLASVWLYAYSQGISSAREIERQMEYEPGLMWL